MKPAGPSPGCAEGPASTKGLADDGFELADVAEGEGPQERAERRRSHHPEGQDPCRAARAEDVDVVDVAGAGHHGVDKGHHLAARACSAHPPGQLHLGVHQALQLESDGHRGDQQQPGVGHQVWLVEVHPDAVDGMRYSTH